MQRTFEALVEETQDLGLGMARLRLSLPKGFSFKAGQFLIVHAPSEEGSDKVPKGYYTLASSALRPNLVDLLIEHGDGLPSGYVSGWMLARRRGDRLTVEGPLGRFGLREPRTPSLGFLGRGAGLAPLLSIILTSLDQGVSGRMVLASAGLPPGLEGELRSLEGRGLELALNPAAGLAQALNAALPAASGADIYCAGFTRDVEPLCAALLEAGHSPERLVVERFG